MTVHSHSDRLLRSSRRNPCPVCGRSKDADCSFNHERSFVLCHHQRTDLIASVDEINGFVFCGNAKDGRTAMFRLDEFERRQW